MAKSQRPAVMDKLSSSVETNVKSNRVEISLNWPQVKLMSNSSVNRAKESY